MSLFEFVRQRTRAREVDRLRTKPEPVLAMLLAQQAIARWRFDLERYENASTAERELVVQEAEASIGQMRALGDRLAPYRNYVDMAVRFEAEELSVALAALREAFARVVARLAEDIPWREAETVAEELVGRRA